MRFELVEDDIQPTHELISTPAKGPVPLEKSYNQDDAHLEKIEKTVVCTDNSCGHFSYCHHKRPCALDCHEFTMYEGIVEGNRFFSSNGDAKADRRRLANGCIAYRILGQANTCDEARKVLAPMFNLCYENKYNIQVDKFFVDIELTSLGCLALTVRCEEYFDGLTKAIRVLVPESLEREKVEF